jgi:hypothetical protein
VSLLGNEKNANEGGGVNYLAPTKKNFTKDKHNIFYLLDVLKGLQGMT